MNTLRDLLLDALRDAYSAEQQLLTALPEFAAVAKTTALKRHFKAHAQTTQSHIGRLCEIFEEFGEAAEGKVSLPMQGLVTEAQKLGQEGMPPALLDAALVAAAHKTAHYQMAAYRSLCGYAESLGERAVAKKLRLSLSEEKLFDGGLTDLAKGINPRAAKAAL